MITEGEGSVTRETEKEIGSDSAGLWSGGTSCPGDGAVLPFMQLSVLLQAASGAGGANEGSA